MSTIAAWARRHRLTVFFGLAFALTWWGWPLYAAGVGVEPFWPWDR